MSYYKVDSACPRERAARHLEQLGGYRVLRPLPEPAELWCHSSEPGGVTTTLGVVDLETTGLNPDCDKPIEIAISKLVVDGHGQVVDVAGPVSWVEDPLHPLTPEIESLTGLTDSMLSGKSFDQAEIDATLSGVDCLISHNAVFDHGFLSRRFPHIALPWGCSARDLNWSIHPGFGHARSLTSLITDAGHFIRDAHRAGPDCWALTCLLAMTAADGRAFAAHLIDAARRTSARVYAYGAPFNLRTDLKSVGYRWNADRKVWWIEGDQETIDNEAVWLPTLHPDSRPVIEPIDWFNRHAG